MDDGARRLIAAVVGRRGGAGARELIAGAAGRRGGATLVAGVLAGGEASFHVARPRGSAAGERTPFEIGSLTKPLTGVLLAEATLRGEVSLDDPVSDHLPASELPRWRGRPPTLRELATHRAGLPNAPAGIGRAETAFGLALRSRDPWADVDRAAYQAAVRATAARRPAGKRFGYSSLGYALLGDALAARSGVPYAELLRDRIGAPLGLGELAVGPGFDAPRVSGTPGTPGTPLEGRSRLGRPRPPLRDQMPAAGAVRASASDLLRLLEAALDPPGAAPGPALALATQPHFSAGRRFSLGLGRMLLDRRGKPRTVLHSGGTWGFRSFAAFAPERRTGVVVLTNTTRSVDRLGMKLLDAARAGDGAGWGVGGGAPSRSDGRRSGCRRSAATRGVASTAPGPPHRGRS